MRIQAGLFTGWARWFSRGCLEMRQWEGRSPSIGGSSCASIHWSSSGAVSWAFPTLLYTSPEQLVPKLILFLLDLKGCFLENPVKRGKQQGRGSFSEVQMVMCPAVPDASVSVGCWKKGHVHRPAAKFPSESSSLHCVTVRWFLSTLLVCQDQMKGGSIPHTRGKKIKAIKETAVSAAAPSSSLFL